MIVETEHLELAMFDLDGTLVETGLEIADATNATLHDFAWPGLDARQVETWIGHGTQELLIRAVAAATAMTVERVRRAGWLPDVAAAFDRHYAANCGTRSRPYPGARELLSRLRDRGTRLAVVTNKECRFATAVLDAHRLTPLLDRVIGGDSLPRRKPDPSGIAACLAEFDVERRRALFVGDSAIDADTARNAGVAVWLLAHGYNMGRPVAEARPDRVLADFAELAAALGLPPCGTHAPVREALR